MRIPFLYIWWLQIVASLDQTEGALFKKSFMYVIVKGSHSLGEADLEHIIACLGFRGSWILTLRLYGIWSHMTLERTQNPVSAVGL